VFTALTVSRRRVQTAAVRFPGQECQDLLEVLPVLPSDAADVRHGDGPRNEPAMPGRVGMAV
jgi:hypothetical protein